MNVALVTDSTADLPPAVVEQYRIQVVPNIIIIDGKSYEEGLGITRREFYQRMPTFQTYPTTSTASVGTYQDIYEGLLQQGAECVLSVHVSGRLSGIFNAASAAAEAFGERVKVVDSGQLTLGMGFQVLSAAEAIARGANLEAALKIIEGVQRRVLVIAMLDTLEYVARSGRVSWARARIGNLLRIKPFVKVKDGDVTRLGDVRTRRRGIERLKEMVLNLGDLERLAILHSNAKSDAYQILQELNVQIPTDPLVVNVTTVIGLHIGPNGLGFAAVTI
jgi:DegV family protein with EDD domain